MEVVLLGTGSADGWPNAFCRCDACTTARVSGIVRGQSSAMVDGTVLLDLGPGVGDAAVRLGRSLAGLRHVLVTHAHADHLAPEQLLFRSWVADAPLDVVGPAAVVDACRDWVAPDAAVRFRPVVAGDELDLGGHAVRVLPAAHRVFLDGDAVLYDVTSPSGHRLLWGCDTGPLPPDWFDRVAGARFDVVLLEETFGDAHHLGAGHLHLGSFAETVAALRECGAVHDATEVVAVHLSHHNPPESELVRRLAGCGARPGRDGDVITLR
ncbi:hypothetical protein HMPREF0063_12349 [Aeromicrobium marinum DSM 15272]|uniref:Metallo-beta-lactamase domain-containing protein n=1 Tax=Aeromicrobium marinum DSM 15272 TaxID=585531 RepID=E2SD37_9ACTN|nr:MBL fold metallo-hydrolase [Aeromicrobium marinum]EFQ83140.1 hypothetical protein HMPREF0063_12349 [Aeromicrobium marinum DSM 15272]